MPLSKPSSKIDWTNGSAPLATEPTSGKKAAGWGKDERPPFQYFNWLFYNLDQWVKYFESITDGVTAAYSRKWLAIVGTGPGCTHSTLAAALADAGIVAGSGILVTESAALAATVQVLKNDVLIEFTSNVTLTNAGGAPTAIQLSASGVRVKGGRFSGFTTAISIDSGKQNQLISENRFAGCTNEVVENDPSPNNAIFGNVSE